PMRPASTSCFTLSQGYSSRSSQRAARSRNSWSASARARAWTASCSAVKGNRIDPPGRFTYARVTGATVGPAAGSGQGAVGVGEPRRAAGDVSGYRERYGNAVAILGVTLGRIVLPRFAPVRLEDTT